MFCVLFLVLWLLGLVTLRKLLGIRGSQVGAYGAMNAIRGYFKTRAEGEDPALANALILPTAPNSPSFWNLRGADIWSFGTYGVINTLCLGACIYCFAGGDCSGHHFLALIVLAPLAQLAFLGACCWHGYAQYKGAEGTGLLSRKFQLFLEKRGAHSFYRMRQVAGARLKQRKEQQMRVPRIKEEGEGFYHVMSRVVDRRMVNGRHGEGTVSATDARCSRFQRRGRIDVQCLG